MMQLLGISAPSVNSQLQSRFRYDSSAPSVNSQLQSRLRYEASAPSVNSHLLSPYSYKTIAPSVNSCLLRRHRYEAIAHLQLTLSYRADSDMRLVLRRLTSSELQSRYI